MRIFHIDEDCIKFSGNGKMYELVYEHEQDCCEEVYADFLSLPSSFLGKDGTEKRLFRVDFEEDLDKLIEEVEGQGFMLCTKDGDKVLVNCYDIQNGWYSSDLAVVLYEKTTLLKEKPITQMIHQYK